MASSQADVVASIEAEMHAALSSAAAGQPASPGGASPGGNPTLSGGHVGALPFDLAAEVRALNESSKEFDAEGSVASLADFMAQSSLVQPDSLAGFPSFKTMRPAGKGLHRAPGGGDKGGSGSSGRGSGSGSGWSASEGSDVTSPSPKATRLSRKMERTRGPAGVVPATKVTGGVARSTLFGGGSGAAAAASSGAVAPAPAPAEAGVLSSTAAVQASDWGDGSADGGSSGRFSAEPLDVSSHGGSSSPSGKSGSSPNSFGPSSRRKVLSKILKPFKKGDGGGRGGGRARGSSGKDDGSEPPSI